MKLKGIKNERDKYWIGLILLLRRRIFRMCDSYGSLSKPSVIRIIDQCLPPNIVRLEKREVKDRRRKNERKIKGKGNTKSDGHKSDNSGTQ